MHFEILGLGCFFAYAPRKTQTHHVRKNINQTIASTNPAAMVLMVSNASTDGPGSPPRASCAVSTMRSCAPVAAIFVLGLGAAGFGRYYWREFTDQVSGTFFTEAIFPTLTHEDPRYYTLGKNGFFRRFGYAISRTVITKNDRGTNEFNISEIAGNASESALSDLYYPAAERGFGKSAKTFATQTVITAGANVLKEFWPDIRKNVFRMKDKSPPSP